MRVCAAAPIVTSRNKVPINDRSIMRASRFHYARERPTRRAPRPSEEEQQADGEQTQAEGDDAPIGCGENKNPADERDETRQRIEPDAERARQVRLSLPQELHGDDLADELHEDARR